MKKIYTAMIFTILLLSGCSDQDSGVGADAVSKNIDSKPKIQKEFVLKDSTGNTYPIKVRDKGIDFENIKDKVVVLDFFATWCPPCRATAPHLVSLQEKYKDSLMIIGMLTENDGNSASNLNKFQNEFETNYTFVVGNEVQALGKSLGGIPSIPYMIIYDKNGNYANHYIGQVPEEMLERDIVKAMER